MCIFHSFIAVGHGFYTLTVMEPKKNGEEDEGGSSVNTQPSDVDTYKNQEKSFSLSDQPSNSENSHILEEDKTPSDVDPKHSGETTSLADVAVLKKSIYASPIPQKVSRNSPQNDAVADLKKTLATACLSFNYVPRVPAAVKAKPDPSTPVVRRPRGRPRKHPLPLVSDSKTHAVVEETRKGGATFVLVEDKQKEKETFEVTTTEAKNAPVVSEVADNPVPAKRGRGRPPKRKSQLCSPPVAQAGCSSSKSNEDRLSCSNTKLKASPAATKFVGATKTSRPLTRGALGKDFPSAKKRSWIDVERELEPELEFD